MIYCKKDKSYTTMTLIFNVVSIIFYTSPPTFHYAQIPQKKKSFGCCASQSSTASFTSSSDPSDVHIKCLLGAKRGVNHCMPNLVNMADCGNTSNFKS
jgi:hypothetical protein